MSKRNSVWQFARGLAIIVVILIHCPNGINYGSDSLNFNSWMILRQFINFPVALFIFMSGYFVNPEKTKDYKQYLVRRGVKLLLPYLVWSLIYLVDFLLGDSAPQLYYCIVLLQLTVLTPLILKWVENKWTCVILYSLTPAWLIYVYASKYSYGKSS